MWYYPFTYTSFTSDVTNHLSFIILKNITKNNFYYIIELNSGKDNEYVASNSYTIIEAFFNKKHCIITRDETEWLELVSNGFAKLVGSDSKQMIKAFRNFQKENNDFRKNLFGNKVGEKIHEAIYKLIQN